MSAASPDTETMSRSSTLELDPALGAVGSWSFDSAANPSAEGSGHSAVAQLVNATWTADGRSAGALYFNGRDAVVTVPDGGWNVGNPATYNLWYKNDGTATGYALEHEFTAGTSGAFAVDAGGARFRSYDSTRRARDYSFGPVAAGAWTMITVVLDGGVLRLYKDGTRVLSTSRRLARRSGPLDIGASGRSRNAFRGWIDEVAVFGRALTDAQVAELHGWYDAPMPPAGADDTWSPLSVLPVTNPMDFGATGDGVADDLPALQAAVDALPGSGGIVYLPSGKSFRKNNLLLWDKSHVKIWAINREAEIFASVGGQPQRQAIVTQNALGSGVFGVKLRSDVTERFSTVEDAQLANAHGTLVEFVGNDISGSGIMLFDAKESYVEGNYIHHTWADHIHHTEGSSESWVWGNTVFNEAPSLGDDGIACVTYGVDGRRCSRMEWWNNVILHTGWGRGYSVIGGDTIDIHDNWAIGVAGAGIIVASEEAFDSSASQGISITRNYIVDTGHTIMHPGILISAGNDDAGPLKDIALDANVSVGNPQGPYREEGFEGGLENVTNRNMSTNAGSLPPRPTAATLADTRVLRTRDLSHVAPEMRHGLYRIHVRRLPTGAGFEQRFEYLIKGPPDAIAAFVQMQQAAGGYLSEQRTINGVAHALLLTSTPVIVPNAISAVSFSDLRTGDRNGELSWLWKRADSGGY